MKSPKYLAIISILILIIFCWDDILRAENSVVVEEVNFDNDTIKISADLSYPALQGKFPVVIWVHGSGNSPRTNPVAQAYRDEFLKRGIAFLNPDKRGSGKSGGDWTIASFDDLASDVSAAVQFIKNQNKLDNSNITILGFSQGSHIASIAGKNKDIKKVISLSGSVVSIHQQIRDEVAIMAKNDGLTEDLIKLVDSLNSFAFDFSESKIKDSKKSPEVEWVNYKYLLNQLLETPFGSSETIAGFPKDSNDPKFGFLTSVGKFNPLEFWEDIEKPILFVYGIKDKNVNVKNSIDILTELMESNENISLICFGEHGHAFIRDDQMDFIERFIKE